ncbi:MAG: polymer-forming cytoskeletal protein [Oscillospiraceae bacterium]|nr:polymer-forming cytoskeletal protein [Oscillospiraceae bacterium]
MSGTARENAKQAFKELFGTPSDRVEKPSYDAPPSEVVANAPITPAPAYDGTTTGSTFADSSARTNAASVDPLRSNPFISDALKNSPYMNDVPRSETVESSAYTVDEMPRRAPTPPPTPTPQAAAPVSAPQAAPQPEPPAAPHDWKTSSSSLVHKTAPVTVIGEDTQIIGTIKTSNSLELYGFVKGDILSEADVFLYGKVNGNVAGNNVFLNAGAVKGDISSASTLRVSHSSAVAGNVRCATISIDGKLLGNIEAAQSAELLDNAVILGDISTSHFAMSETSRLQGVVNISSRDSMGRDNFDAYFDF